MRLYRCRIGRTGTRLSCLMIICLVLHAHPGAGQTAGQVGAWSGVIPLPNIPIAAALLPNGQVLTWSSFQPRAFETDIGDNPSDTYTSLFDPVSETSVTTILGNPPVDMFCPGIANLPDGRVLVNGGSSSPKTTIYDPKANTWSADADMNIPRGYNGDVLLTTGEVLTLGGSWSGPYCVEKIGEVWAANSGWGLRNGIGANPITGPDPDDSPPCVVKGDAHAWLFTVGNGEVFHAGPSAEMHWISTSGSGSIVSAGNRGDDAYSMNGKAVMYDIGRILKTGGAPAYSSVPATAATYLIDVNAAVADPTQPVVVQETAPMAYPRAFANGVVLPNGQVLIVGGQTYAQTFNDDNSVLVPELWDPASETFTELAPMQTPRNYHSVALLLPAGRVFVGGGGGCGCSVDHPDAEIFSPPYLFNSDGSPATRPTIVSAPTSAQLGSTVAVQTNADVSAFAILRLSAATHTVNNDQRRIPLSFTSGLGHQYTLSVPGDAGVAVPGYYLLFAITPNGTPSVGQMIKIG